MKQFEVQSNKNPTFQTVTGLTNTTWDSENVVPSRGATEGQLAQVYTVLKDVKDYLDENGCTDDPWEYIKQQVEELEQKQEECCGTDWSANVTQNIYERLEDLEDQIEECCTIDHSETATTNILSKLTELETQIEECCNLDHGETAITNILDRLDELEAQIEECCNKASQAYTGAGTCDGNVITVSFAWNGSNPLQDGGKATAVSADSERAIAGFYFLVRNVNTGLYYRSATANGGDWTWTIDANGNVTAASGGGSMNFSNTIVAVDANGCEGSINVDLPYNRAIGG